MKMPEMPPLEAAKELDIVDQEYSMDPRYIDSRKMYAVHSAITYLRAIAAGEYKPAHAHITGHGYDLHCSNCGESADIGRNYCPSCGALMGKDDSHEVD